MAEVASLVLGILPLGLQLVREVRDYLSAIEQRAFDLEAAATEIDILEHSLKTVDSVVSQVASIDVSSKENIARVCDLVQRKVKLISTLVKDITTNAGVDSSLLNKAKARTRVLLYPYKKEHLTKLQTELRSLNALLTSALRPLDYAYQKQLQSETHALIVAEIRQVESSVLKTSDIMVVASEMAKRPSLLAATASRAGVTNADVEMASLTLGTAVKAQERLNYLHRSQDELSLCRCRQSVVQKRAVSSYGPVFLISEERQEFTHLPACKFRESRPLSRTRSYRLGWRFENDQQYMATVLALAINVVTTGRGEWCLSPSIQAFNHIELRASPIIRLAGLYSRLFVDFWLDRKLGAVSSKIVKGYWRCSLKRLIQEGRASPLDLDSRTGGTALHSLVRHNGDDQFFWESVRELGIPNHILDRNGSSAWDRRRFRDVPCMTESLTWLLPADALMPQNTMAPLGSPPDGRSPTLFGYRIWRTVCQMHDFPEVMEDQLTTPFLRAIITRSKDDMLRMLLEDSELEDRLREEFRAGQIAVAAADLIMLWFPLGAAALMDLHHRTEAGRAPVGLLHTVAASAELPLLWSLVNGFNCSRRAGRSTKGYLDAISTLLQLDCAVPNALLSFIQWELLHTPIHIASKVYDTDLAKLLTLCASHLANRRQRLTRTARKYLGQQELQVLGLLGFAPAIHMLEGMDAAKAWQMLLSKGLNTPTALDPCLGDRFNEAEDKEWVYGGCDASGTAELLFEAGHTPDKMVLAWIETRSSIPLRSSAFVAWLLVRCADKTLVSPVPTNFAIPGKRNVHLLSAELGNQIARDQYIRTMFKSREHFKFLTAPLSDLQPSLVQYESKKWADSCACFCSDQGCTPLIDFIKQAARRIHFSMNSLDPEKTLACVLWYARSTDASSTTGVCSSYTAMAFVRVWSFELLECRHTCCADILSNSWTRNNVIVMPDQEEREEIQEEDGLRLNILERLQEDMKLKWLSSQNHQLTLEGFVRDEWWPTLAQSLQQIEADAETLEEAICGMESVGVKAGPVPFLEEGTWVLSDAIASDVSSIASDVDEDEREQWEQNAVLAYKRSIDRICDREEPANGATTGRGRWRRSYG